MPGGRGLTPDHIAARYAQAKRINNLVLRAGKWDAVQVEVPTILTPQAALDNILLYSSEVVTRSTTLALGGPPDTYSNKCYQVSVGPGNIYLPSKGLWEVFNPSANDAFMLVIDATDPAVAVRYLAEAGNHGQTGSRSATVAGTPTATQILAANRYRTGIILQNDHASITLRVGFGTESPVYGANPVGYLLGVGATLTLTSTTLIKGIVSVTASAANGSYQCYEIF
jgi:hypothetical protein